MLRAILLIDDASRMISFHSLQTNCRMLHRCKTEQEAAPFLQSADAVVLHTPAARLPDWQGALARRRLPLLWLCTEETVSGETDWGYAIDGILAPSMTSTEIAYALRFAVRSHQQRRRWAEEREQLLQRLEERKWIDQAKAVLCEVKGISEAEAYDFLRKQAMNERKRVGDIAASIVKVYQLIHG